MPIDLTSGMDPSEDHFLAERPEDPQFRWDGEESYGMMERSIPVSQLED